VVYAKRLFAGPQALLACLLRYTHRVAIANSRLLAFNDQGVIFLLFRAGVARSGFSWFGCIVKGPAPDLYVAIDVLDSGPDPQW